MLNKEGLTNKYCHAELDSASTLYTVHRFRNEFGMTLRNELFWSAPISENFMALYYDLPVLKDNTKSMLKYKYEQRKKRQNLISVNLL